MADAEMGVSADDDPVTDIEHAPGKQIEAGALPKANALSVLETTGRNDLYSQACP
jgi:hypothetical protein